MVTFHDLKCPRGHEEGSLVAMLRIGVSSLPVNRCLRAFQMVFAQKRRLSIFSHCLIIERPQNWPSLGSLSLPFSCCMLAWVLWPDFCELTWFNDVLKYTLNLTSYLKMLLIICLLTRRPLGLRATCQLLGRGKLVAPYFSDDIMILSQRGEIEKRNLAQLFLNRKP